MAQQDTATASCEQCVCAMQDFLNDSLDLVQGLEHIECNCSMHYFYGTCEHVHKTMLLVDDTEVRCAGRWAVRCVCVLCALCAVL